MVRGVVLGGGTGSRLFPLTKLSNKHLLPVYNRPMIYFPINTLVKAGIKEILVISGAEYAEDFLRLLGNGKEFGAKFTYEIQEGHLGIADALRLAKDFSSGGKIVAILGDNIFKDNIKGFLGEFESDKDDNAMIFLKQTPNAKRFGVAEIKKGKILGIAEKPKKPKSNYAVTGLYFYPSDVFEVIESLKPSKRGEYEITDVNNHYIKKGRMKGKKLPGFWSDAGTFESLFRASKFVKENSL